MTNALLAIARGALGGVVKNREEKRELEERRERKKFEALQLANAMLQQEENIRERDRALAHDKANRAAHQRIASTAKDALAGEYDPTFDYVTHTAEAPDRAARRASAQRGAQREALQVTEAQRELDDEEPSALAESWAVRGQELGLEESRQISDVEAALRQVYPKMTQGRARKLATKAVRGVAKSSADVDAREAQAAASNRRAGRSSTARSSTSTTSRSGSTDLQRKYDAAAASLRAKGKSPTEISAIIGPRP
jgi:hypothetical protein